MKPWVHAVASGTIAAGVYAVTRSVPGVTATFLVGTAVDADHVLDYARSGVRQSQQSGWRFDFRTLWYGEYFRSENRHFILGHAWEWLPLLVLAAWWLTRLPVVAGGVGLSYGVHLLLDHAAYPLKWGVYSLSARWRARFELKALLRKGK